MGKRRRTPDVDPRLAADLPIAAGVPRGLAIAATDEAATFRMDSEPRRILDDVDPIHHRATARAWLDAWVTVARRRAALNDQVGAQAGAAAAGPPA